MARGYWIPDLTIILIVLINWLFFFSDENSCLLCLKLQVKLEVVIRSGLRLRPHVSRCVMYECRWLHNTSIPFASYAWEYVYGSPVEEGNRPDYVGLHCLQRRKGRRGKTRCSSSNSSFALRKERKVPTPQNRLPTKFHWAPPPRLEKPTAQHSARRKTHNNTLICIKHSYIHNTLICIKNSYIRKYFLDSISKCLNCIL